MFSTSTSLEDDLSQCFLELLCGSVIVLRNGVKPRHLDLKIKISKVFSPN